MVSVAPTSDEVLVRRCIDQHMRGKLRLRLAHEANLHLGQYLGKLRDMAIPHSLFVRWKIRLQYAHGVVHVAELQQQV